MSQAVRGQTAAIQSRREQVRFDDTRDRTGCHSPAAVAVRCRSEKRGGLGRRFAVIFCREIVADGAFYGRFQLHVFLSVVPAFALHIEDDALPCRADVPHVGAGGLYRADARAHHERQKRKVALAFRGRAVAGFKDVPCLLACEIVLFEGVRDFAPLDVLGDVRENPLICRPLKEALDGD